MLEKLELQRLVAGLLRELEEPLRTAVLLRFFEGKTPSEIAAAQGVPAGTVRWRISEGLRRLRERLDERHGGQRDAWRALLIPLVDGAAPGPSAPKAVSTVAPRWAVLGIGALAVTGALTTVLIRTTRPPPSVASALHQRGAAGAGPPSSQEAEPMKNKQATKAAALFGVVIPALVAGAEASKPLPRDEAIAFCVEQREWIVQKCKEEYADLMVERVPPERREARRKEWLKKLEEGGSGPLGPRQQKCAEELDRKAQLASISTYAGRAAIRACQQENDCQKALTCVRQLMFGPPPPKK
jgi:hypothetical protein